MHSDMRDGNHTVAATRKAFEAAMEARGWGRNLMTWVLVDGKYEHAGLQDLFEIWCEAELAGVALGRRQAAQVADEEAKRIWALFEQNTDEAAWEANGAVARVAAAIRALGKGQP
jgi:hypothetical protein